ncbi:uncharacterized protein LOC115321262 [Ixodes scapularis]|uniref:uncharacterized protein LOC115321262 n=1 Tax=Ixodes scapularis TaxID=6945 RepID=UPI0011617397|nr:uncharacterized protein LOC115321262 [Ixodes scapularis]
MTFFNKQLVLEVRKHQELWDQHSKLHKEANMREAAWLEISRELNVSVEECQTRWRTIRDTYLKRKKRQGSVVTRGQWHVLDKELFFLDDFLRPRTRAARTSLRARTSLVKMEIEEPAEEATDDSSHSATPLALPAPSRGPVEDRSRSRNCIVPDNAIVDYAIVERLEESQRSDPEDLFCLSLAAQLRGLAPGQRNLAKMRMLKTMHDVEFGALGDATE